MLGGASMGYARGMSDLVTHEGGCHCGAVRYRVETDLAKVMECNCSHCSKKGFLFSFVSAEQFTLLEGEDGLTEYRFHTKQLQHLFCKSCGAQSFARGKGRDGGATVAINVRCLDGVDVSSLTITPVDGKSC
jgi:hypothetical protein